MNEVNTVHLSRYPLLIGLRSKFHNRIVEDPDDEAIIFPSPANRTAYTE